jgi:hypothetical protein
VTLFMWSGKQRYEFNMFFVNILIHRLMTDRTLRMILGEAAWNVFRRPPSRKLVLYLGA